MVKGLTNWTVTVKSVTIPNTDANIIAALLTSDNTGISLGIHDDPENAIKAYVAEVGSDDHNIPPRPFLTEAMNDEISLQNIFDDIFRKDKFKGDDLKPALRALGRAYVKHIKSYIYKADSWAIPNSESTIERKLYEGITEPKVLRWTDDMLKAIKFKLIKGSYNE